MAMRREIASLNLKVKSRHADLQNYSKNPAEGCKALYKLTMTTMPSNASLFARAEQVIPGGVNSPVRAFRAVQQDPRFIASAQGAYMTDVEGKRYVDFIGSWGPMILGHAHPEVLKAVEVAMRSGTSFGAPTQAEVEFAELLCQTMPSMQMVRLTSSGTEAVMGALRAARGFTQRDVVVKFEGCYHGGADYLLVKAGSGAATLGAPDSAGVPSAIAGTTMLMPFNDIDALTQAFELHASRIAAVILEPVVGNMGCVPPRNGYLKALHDLCRKSGVLLVFDEVMTGFRLARGGAQALYGVEPDLTCFGKIAGGGLPLGGYGGRRDVMSVVAPLGPVYQAGTLSGNPLAVAAGKKTLELLQKPNIYEQLETTSAKVEQIITRHIERHHANCRIQRVGSMLTVFFTDTPVSNWSDAKKADTQKFANMHRTLLENGVYWPPSQFEAAFISLAFDDETLAITDKAFDAAFQSA